VNAARILRYARRRAGLSQRALAEASGVPQPQIARIERGLNSPRLATLERLLAATDSSLEIGQRLGEGVDRTLIRATLALSPEERLSRAARAGNRLGDLLREVGHGTRA
jgi:transcriptional regulator with XRE-family HTH domain